MYMGTKEGRVYTRKRTNVVPCEFGHLWTDETEVVSERLTDELNVLSRWCVTLTGAVS